MLKRVLLIPALTVLPLAFADETSTGDTATASTSSFSVDLTAGLTSTFQMPLGGSFGAGPDIMDTLTASWNDAFRAGDSFSVFGWNTTDLPSTTADWQGGVDYATRILHRGRHSLAIGGGVQRWVLPNVASGAKDWLCTGHLTYSTKVEGVPLYVTENSWSLVKSTLPTGSAVYTQVYTQHNILKKENFQLLLQQGPAHSYSWNFYGLQGNCVLHYSGSLTAIWHGNAIRAGYRRQFGLQDKVPNSNYWEFSITRQLFKVHL